VLTVLAEYTAEVQRLIDAGTNRSEEIRVEHDGPILMTPSSTHSENTQAK
jgi:hypothetical protein